MFRETLDSIDNKKLELSYFLLLVQPFDSLGLFLVGFSRLFAELSVTDDLVDIDTSVGGVRRLPQRCSLDIGPVANGRLIFLCLGLGRLVSFLEIRSNTDLLKRTKSLEPGLLGARTHLFA